MFILLFFSSIIFGITTVKENNAVTIENPTDMKIEMLGDFSESFSTEPHRLSGITFMDGSIFGITTSHGFIYEYDAVTGVSIGNYSLPFATGGIANDGTNLYISTYLTPPNGTIAKFNSTGAMISSIHTPLSVGVFRSLTWDGTHLWAFQTDVNNLHRIDPDTGVIIKTITLPFFPADIEWYNGLLWCVDYIEDRVIAFDPQTGSAVEGFASPYLSSSGIACNDTHLFHSNSDSFDEVSITRIPTNPGDVYLREELSISNASDIAYGNKQFFVCENQSTSIRTYDISNAYTSTWSVPFHPVGLTVMFDAYLAMSSEESPYNIYTYSFDGTQIKSHTALDVMIKSLAFDGAFLWAMGQDNILYKLDPLDMSTLEEFPVSGIYGITYDYNNDVIWGYERDEYLIRAINTTTGEFRDEFIDITSIGPGFGYGLTFTGEHLVLAKFTDSDSYYYKIIPIVIEDEPTPTPTPSETDTQQPGYFIPNIPGYAEDLIAFGIGVVLASIIVGIIVIVRRSKR